MQSAILSTCISAISGVMELAQEFYTGYPSSPNFIIAHLFEHVAFLMSGESVVKSDLSEEYIEYYLKMFSFNCNYCLKDNRSLLLCCVD